MTRIDPRLVEYFWRAYEETHYAEDLSNVVTWKVTDRDRALFPELRDVQSVTLYQDDEGRVHLA